jgi:hypothetical protein
MFQPVSIGLKFGFLIVLYLFLFWVATSALFDLRHGFGRSSTERPSGSDETGIYSTVDPLQALPEEFEPRLVVDHAAGHNSGVAYDLSAGVTLGRGDVEIQLQDPFASSLHARISRRGHTLVLEDLGSTNGTYLNGEQVGGPQPLHEGDEIRIGDSHFTYLQ